MNQHNSIVIFGAGCIGRGLLGEIATRAGWRCVFVEAVPELARRFARAGEYVVHFTGRCPSASRVAGFSVLASSDRDAVAAALESCALAATAVGGDHLRDVAGLIAPVLAARPEPLNLLVCENWPHADKVLSDALLDGHASSDDYACIPCSVERMVRSEAGSLDLCAESCESVYVDHSSWKGPVVDMPGLIACGDIEPLYARKLFTNNAGHAVLAYEGFLAGCETLCEALRDSEIRARLQSLLDGAAEMLHRAYGMDRIALNEHVQCLVAHRYANAALADRVERVARSPLRKLGPDERLTGLLRRLEAHQLPIELRVPDHCGGVAL